MSPAERAKSALYSFAPGGSHAENTKLGAAFRKAGGEFEDFDAWRAQDADSKGTTYNRSQWKSYDALDVGAGLLFYLAAQENDWRDPDPDPPPRHTNGTGTPHKAAQRDADGSAADEDTGERAVDLWLEGKPAHNHLYVTRKGLRDACDSDRLRVAAHDPACLLVPVRALSDGAPVVAIQRIFADGTKRTLGKLTPFPGCCYVIGELRDGVTVIAAEGMATGEAIAWACPAAVVVVTAGVGRMREVMTEIRARYPASPRVLVADRGRHACDATREKPADHIETLVARAAQETRSAWVRMPPEEREAFDAWDFATTRGPDALAVWIAGGGRHPYTPRYIGLTPETVIAQPVLHDLIDDVIPARSVGAIWAISGAAKTFLALDLACSLAQGVPFFGHDTFNPVPVAVISLEGNSGLTRRYRAWVEHNAQPMPATLYTLQQPFSLLDAADLEDLCEFAEQAGVSGGVLIIDPFALATLGMQENDSADMGRVIASLYSLRDRTGCTVIVIHHTGKRVENGMRGSSNLPYLLDFHLEVTRDRTSGARGWSVGKSKEAPDELSHEFRLVPVVISEKPNGRPLVSCVIEDTTIEARGRGEVRKPLGKPKSANQALAYEIVGSLLAAGGSLGAGEGCPPDRPCVLLETAVRALAAKLFQYDERRRYNVAKTVISAMQTKYYGCDGNWLWRKPDGD